MHMTPGLTSLLTHQTVSRMNPILGPAQMLLKPIERKIAKRWAEWLPWATIEAKRRTTSDIPFAALMAVYEDTHRRTLSRLLLARVKWSTIRNLRLDNPIESEETRERAVAAAIERSRARYAGHARGRARRHRANQS